MFFNDGLCILKTFLPILFYSYTVCIPSSFLIIKNYLNQTLKPLFLEGFLMVIILVITAIEQETLTVPSQNITVGLCN